MVTFMLPYIPYSPEVSSLIVELIYETYFPVLFFQVFPISTFSQIAQPMG